MTGTEAAAGPRGAAHVVADQAAVLRFLSTAAAYGAAVPPIRIDTQGAIVFLAGDKVYKVKRAVKFPFMDLSTLEKRRAACEAEIAVNHDNAPSIYLGTVPVTRLGDGLALGGSGEVIEWTVCMRRFDERQTLDLVAGREGLPPPLIAKLVRAILASHRRAPVAAGLGAAESLRRYLVQNSDAFAESPELFPERRAKALTVLAKSVLQEQWALLLERGDTGYIRRCHGDLHLRNIVLLNGEPALFDAIEFDDSIATGDVLYDLAFLLMDLWERGLETEANLVLNRYLWGGDEAHLDALALLPLFLSIRAAIRAKVTAASRAHLAGAEREAAAAQARRYFGAAEEFLKPCAPRLIAIGGLSGTGKTTLAATIAPAMGRSPGAVHLRSDIERKVLAGVAETDRLPASSYTQAASDAVYEALRRKAATALAAGQSVVVDAVHARPEERDAIAAVATTAGAPFAGLWLEAPLEALVDRVRGRVGDASDATEDVVRGQHRYDVGDITWSRLDTATGSRQIAAVARSILGLVPGGS